MVVVVVVVAVVVVVVVVTVVASALFVYHPPTDIRLSEPKHKFTRRSRCHLVHQHLAAAFATTGQHSHGNFCGGGDNDGVAGSIY